MAVDFLEEKYKKGIVFHDTINKILQTKTFGKTLQVPHEWYFINVLMNEVQKDYELADKFMMYVHQYYKPYGWLWFDSTDYLSTVVLECGFHQFQFQKRYEFGINEDDEILSESMLFGEIVTDFLIRYYGYSLIKCSGQKIILTAHSDCHKRFEELLSKGYTLQRRKKAGYIRFDKHIYLKGAFYRLPVLPTKDVGYPIDEIIEVGNDKYEKILHL